MAADEVFTIPHSKNLDGLNLPTDLFRIMFEKKIDDYRRLKEGDDTLIATYPRTGTTWLSQVVSLLHVEEDKYEEAKQTHIFNRVPNVEICEKDNKWRWIDRLCDVPTPRVLKTHLPYRFIRRWIDEDNVKTIITTRNPKDTLVSLFHVYQSAIDFCFNGSWDDFFKHVQAGKVLYGDQYEWLKDWDDNRDKGQLLFIKYEDMKQDLLGEMTRIIAFLGLRVSPKRVQQVIQDTTLKQMKHDFHDTPGYHPGTFVRSGQCGEWKKYFTVEQNEWFDNKYKKLYEGLSIDVHYD